MHKIYINIPHVKLYVTLQSYLLTYVFLQCTLCISLMDSCDILTTNTLQSKNFYKL